jgi:thiol-disulfide isomerase/thioredoxin
VFKAKRRTVVTATAVAVVLLGGALAATLLTGGNGGTTKGETTSGNVITYQVGYRPLAPNATGKSLTGSTINLDSYRGKTLVLNFWGSWCPPCRGEAPTFAVLDEQYSKQGVAFLGDDVYDNPASALTFTHSVGITYPSFNDPDYLVVDDFTQVGVKVSDTPTTLVIDKTGHVAGMIIGAASYGDISTLIKDAAVS